MKTEQNTTIAAVSTAYGEGGIGIVRISGSEADGILARLFVRGKDASAVCEGEGKDSHNATGDDSGGNSDGSDKEFSFASRHMYYGHIIDPDSGEVVDEVLAVFMRGPRTYTGEDVAEIHCHGSTVSLRRILEAALNCGAEAASPGEFTQRAFLSGRIDLAQAEAVIDVVRAKTERSASAAVAQLGGGLSRKIETSRGLLADALALAVVHIDYPDDDKDFRDEDSAQAQMTASLRDASSQISELIKTADTGRILREGLNIVIAGAANAGKSSLLNALLKESRAIVTAIPGTTRDSIEEQANIRGIPVRLTDTAGIRETDNEIEKIGIEKARNALMDADLIVFLVDGSKEIDEDDIEALKLVVEMIAPPPGAQGFTGDSSGNKLAIALSKADLPQMVTEEDLEYLITDVGLTDKSKLYTIRDDGRLYTIQLSAETGEGTPALEDIIEGAVYGGAAIQREEPLVTNARHKDLLTRAAFEIEAAAGELTQTGNIDLAETNIRTAYDSLGEITGETATDDILDRIFSRFCIGK